MIKETPASLTQEGYLNRDSCGGHKLTHGGVDSQRRIAFNDDVVGLDEDEEDVNTDSDENEGGELLEGSEWHAKENTPAPSVKDP